MTVGKPLCHAEFNSASSLEETGSNFVKAMAGTVGVRGIEPRALRSRTVRATDAPHPGENIITYQHISNC